MDDLSRDFNKDVLKEMWCPECMQYKVPPIRVCINGHSICSNCKKRVTRCPICKAKFSEISSVALENIARSEKYPCANRQRGCLEFLSMEHIADHHAACVYGKTKCPFTINKTCKSAWNGFKSDLKEHANAAHKDRFFESPSLRAVYVDGVVSLLSYFGEFFVTYQRIRHGKLYCAVQLIGTNSEASKYKCEFTLRAPNGIEQISKTLFVRSYSEDFEKIFKSGKCFCLDEAVVRHFLVENNISFTIKLSTVQ